MFDPRSSVRCSPRRGNVLVLVAVCLPVMLAIAALALDGGLLLTERRHAQAVADAAARAAACDLYQNFYANWGTDPKGTAAASALLTAAANGYSNDGTASLVTVNIPPQSGDHAGQKGYAEVLVQFNQNRMFSSIFGSGTIPISARAVARGTVFASTPPVTRLVE